MLFAVVKRYERNGVDFADWEYKPNAHEKIYEKMMVVTNADNMQYENSRVYNIDRIVLGYARIYEPSTDAHTGILIPVWDFFGSMTSESEYNGETESNTSKDPNESFLTINAVDGSIIDRNLGY